MAAVQRRFKSEIAIARYASYIDRLLDRNLPVLLSFDHLADTTGLSSSKLRSMAFASHLFYRSFSVPKRSGGVREINAPTAALKELQSWVVDKILKPAFPEVPECTSAYVPNRSILTHVMPHVEANQLLKLDIKDFFPSITTRVVFRIFQQLGYTAAVSRTLAAITTVNDQLPQGSPSSPMLSNLAMTGFDLAVSQLCARTGLRYTRYADDLVLSGQCVAGVEDDVIEILREFGFELNYKKTRTYNKSGEARIVTGLLLNGGSVRLPKRVRRKVRLQAHMFMQVLRGEIAGHAAPPGLHDRAVHVNDRINDLLFAERILGRLQFWSWVEKVNPYPRQAAAEIRALLSEFNDKASEEVPAQ